MYQPRLWHNNEAAWLLLGINKLCHMEEDPFSELNFKLADFSDFSDISWDGVPLGWASITIALLSKCQVSIWHNNIASPAIPPHQAGQVVWLDAATAVEDDRLRDEAADQKHPSVDRVKLE